MEIKFKTIRKNLQRVLEIIGSEIKNLKEKGVAKKELIQAKKYSNAT